ncbi:hypothetical protein F2P81_022364 [Scophthalmus maximus]|uniref:C2H2-type domain-containing protein n=1 Tax=Scophthalmus maximus TaxID=52904 RepID=A0A6A4RU31_SCOMX|nr:hypothetical protein F2P81_022364 [Scophthalmus maximus]
MDPGDNGGEEKPPRTDMKRPKSPVWLDSSPPPKSQEVQEEEEEGGEEERKVGAGYRAKRERRQSPSGATMCQVCSIQLNSVAQAQIHYRGKTHQRRLRRFAKAVSTVGALLRCIIPYAAQSVMQNSSHLQYDMVTGFGNYVIPSKRNKICGALSQSQVHPLLGSLPLPRRALQPQTHAQLEHFLPLRVNGSSPLSLFPNFNTVRYRIAFFIRYIHITQMDPVQKAVISHTFGVAPHKKKPIISCNICHLRFNSTQLHATPTCSSLFLCCPSAVRESGTFLEKGQKVWCVPTCFHVIVTLDRGPGSSSQPSQQQTENTQGSSLAATAPSQPSSMDSLLRSPQLSPQASPGPQLSDPASERPPVEWCSLATGSAPRIDPQGSSTGGEDEAGKADEAKETKSNKKQLHCPTCKVTVNSSSQLEAHCSGSKHKQMLDGQNSSLSQRRAKMTSSPRPSCRIKQRMVSKTRAVVRVSNQPFHCELCQVSVNSETQLTQHMNSRRHKERLAGKPVKAKFTPYNKLQPSAVLATKLALQKQLSKTLSSGFLTSPLNPAALCALAPGPLALRLPPGPSAFFQGPLISPTLFRPAPGPLRATHAPIIFSPY